MTTPTAEGVTVGLFCAVEKHLRRTYRGKAVVVDAAMMNRWISLLGQIEREYRELARARDTGEHRPAGCYPAIPPSPDEGQNPPSGGSSVVINPRIAELEAKLRTARRDALLEAAEMEDEMCCCALDFKGNPIHPECPVHDWADRLRRMAGESK